MKHTRRESSKSRATRVFHRPSYFEPKRETTRSVIEHCAITFALRSLVEYSQLGMFLFNGIRTFYLTRTKAVVETIAYFSYRVIEPGSPHPSRPYTIISQDSTL